MKLSDFDFDLPKALIADRPMEPREAAKLLVIGETLEDRHVADLPDLLNPGDIIVVNDTKVIPAQLKGKRGDAMVDITLHKPLGMGRWQAFARGAKKLKPGDTITFGDAFTATVESRGEGRAGGEVILDFAMDDGQMFSALELFGAAPLPPYIPRETGADARDTVDYQTIFAANPGAVAAPTAGFHFTDTLLEAIKAHGVAKATVTLHVGGGTFLPVKVDDIKDHKMHAERAIIDQATADKINQARERGGRVVAIGTTAARLLETAADDQGKVQAFEGDTDIFMSPGYTFRAVDLLLSNFHLPKSTLFMLVAALAGLDKMKGAYDHAKAQKYRFYSYGDCCLISPAPGARLGDTV
ncbi:MAG: tRNA preQ1(34) S-adenosylmethionine ribosyltransferase-isomerase QueA [Rhodospirillales bacterium]|nr:tRNA preQ1(34) S-adenosylmethionine ribosyltransferase-isomerase QueA [Rhodospirillales bacterium]